MHEVAKKLKVHQLKKKEKQTNKKTYSLADHLWDAVDEK